MKFLSAFTAAAIAFCIAAPACATTVQGTLTDTDSFAGYMGVMTDIQTSPASGLLPSSGFVFCLQHDNHWAGTGARDLYTLGDSFAPYLSSPATVDKATAMLDYVVDNYYTPLVQGDFGSQAGHGFNLAIWQITNFDGTRNSMQVEATDPRFDPYGNQLYVAIMGDLYEHFDAIAPSYRSSSFNIAFLQDGDSTKQSLALVTPITAAVPEPSTVGLMTAGGFVIALRARRSRRKG